MRSPNGYRIFNGRIFDLAQVFYFVDVHWTYPSWDDDADVIDAKDAAQAHAARCRSDHGLLARVVRFNYYDHKLSDGTDLNNWAVYTASK